MNRLAQTVASSVVALVAVVAVDRGSPTDYYPPTLVQQATTWSSTLASSGTNNVNTYRIPALADADGVLVAVYDARKDSAKDLGYGGRINIMQRRSMDQGRTWEPERMIVSHQSGPYSYGDASLTWDAERDRLWMFYTGAPDGVHIHNSSSLTSNTSTTTTHLLARYSDSQGEHWSGEIPMTSLLKPTGATGIWTSSGAGRQLADGTLMVPYAYLINGESHGRYAYSTDGITWQRGADVGTDTNEHKVTQLADGTLMDSARSGAGVKHRMLATSPGPAGPWSTPVAHVSLPDPIVNGDVIRVDPNPASLRADWLLHSNPDSQTTRQHGVVRLSLDNGVTWPLAWTVQQPDQYATFGYSTMVRFSDGSFGIFYEHKMPNSLVFLRFTLDVFGPA